MITSLPNLSSMEQNVQFSAEMKSDNIQFCVQPNNALCYAADGNYLLNVARLLTSSKVSCLDGMFLLGEL